jgi:hypothetical protein
LHPGSKIILRPHAKVSRQAVSNHCRRPQSVMLIGTGIQARGSILGDLREILDWY